VLCRAVPLQGTLAQLDSPNPVFYMNFPSGRLKFSGTLLFPANKYMVLRLGGGPGGAALAEDVFENIVSVHDGCGCDGFCIWPVCGWSRAEFSGHAACMVALTVAACWSVQYGQ
jgi:hypothetical protein